MINFTKILRFNKYLSLETKLCRWLRYGQSFFLYLHKTLLLLRRGFLYIWHNYFIEHSWKKMYVKKNFFFSTTDVLYNYIREIRRKQHWWNAVTFLHFNLDIFSRTEFSKMGYFSNSILWYLDNFVCKPISERLINLNTVLNCKLFQQTGHDIDIM